MTIECVMESWWDNNFFVKLRRPRIVKILFFFNILPNRSIVGLKHIYW